MESESSVCESARVSLSQMSPPTEYSDGMPGNDEQPGSDELCSRIRGIHTSMKRVHPEHKEDILAVSSSHLVWKGCSASVPTRQKKLLIAWTRTSESVFGTDLFFRSASDLVHCFEAFGPSLQHRCP